jgi:hypothetical protein
LYPFTAKGYEGAYSTGRIKFLKKQPQKGRGTGMFTRMGYNHKKSDETVISNYKKVLLYHNSYDKKKT